MAVAPHSSPKTKSPFSSKKKALETKRRLLQKKAHKPNKHVSFDLPRHSIVSYEPKVATTVHPPSHQAVQAKSDAMDRANMVQASLPSKFPSFVKPMLPSHVTGGFWLSFPKKFSDLHLPKHDDTVVLVDEDDQEFETKYLIDKNGLSGGWRGFSIAHKLLEGDALVFQLIKPCKFKVYIVRINGFAEIDGAISLLNLHPSQENAQEKEMAVFDQSGNESDDIGSEVMEGLRFSQTILDLTNVKSINDFNIVVDNLVIDSEIPKHFRIKYYDLCCSQKTYLHENLLKGLNIKLAVGIIQETITIADAIRACKVNTNRDDFETWDKTLKAFEEFGMNVGFLRGRIRKLVSLLFDSQKVMEAKRNEQVKAEEEMRFIEEKLCGLREVMKNLDSEVEILKLKGEDLEPVFHKEANAPW